MTDHTPKPWWPPHAARRHVQKPAPDAAPADPPEEQNREARYGEAIWTTSRADEGTISATGANIVARAVMAVADAEQAELQAELAMYKRGGKTLGETIEKQCRMVLDATGLHDWVDEDGDGDWGAIWDHLFDLRARAERAESNARGQQVVIEAQRATLDRVRALADDTLRQRTVHAGGRWREVLDVDALRAILDAPQPEAGGE